METVAGIPIEFIVIIAFVLVIMAVLWGISIHLVKTGKLSAGDWAKRSLGLPRGSVRAIIAFIIIFLLLYSALKGVSLPDKMPDWLIAILGTVIGFYFGAAMVPSGNKEEKGEKQDKPGDTPAPEPK